MFINKCQTRKNLKKEEGSGSKKTGNPKNKQGKMKNKFNWIYGCSYVIKRKQTQKNKKKGTKIQRQTKTGKKKKQRIDQERKQCNSIVRCCFFMKAKQKKTKRRRLENKKDNTQKNNEKIRRVKGHFTWPLSPPPPQIKSNFVLSKKGRLKTHMHFQTKNAEIIFWKLPDSWHQRNTKRELSVHKIAWNHYKIRPKTNLDQIITPILGPDKTVTPERANLDQQENMSRRGRREERKKIKRGRKNITAENAKPTKHYKNSGSRQLSRTPRLEHRKQSIFEKAATKSGFGGRHRIHYVYSGFVRFFFSENEKHEIHTREGRPLKTSRFFFAGGKVIRSPFRSKPNFERKSTFWEASPTENPIFTEEFWQGLEKSKTKQRRTTRGDLSEQHFCRVFFVLPKLRLRKGSELKNDISENEVW